MNDNDARTDGGGAVDGFETTRVSAGKPGCGARHDGAGRSGRRRAKNGNGPGRHRKGESRGTASRNDRNDEARRSRRQTPPAHGSHEFNGFDADDLKMMSDAFHADRRARGPQQADADWVSEPLDEWLASLEDGTASLDDDTMAAFAVGMNETLSIRDALILSLIVDQNRCPKSQLMEFAAKPHSEHARRRMGTLLTAAFEDEGLVPDEERCRTGITMLLDIACASPVPYCIQPLAVAAYALWWLGDSSAAALALQCLVLDEDCSLAAMVFSASDRGVFPAWCACENKESAM
ncbi:hypothetical protein BREU_1526 [Bifidobacterium reuteri DSM 23975]|uniref:DUF4192 family protein n=2 Tax=Bifidobacterium reuteri TaxID=983706 RepID=A0A087CSU8_9BIFI|nr:hypothetical protein BREU_1526 [Bifidobacterium reuteri DSM 23975]